MTAAQHPESAQRNSTPAPTPPQHHPRPEAKLDQLPVELLRLVITHLDPPAKLSWAALSTHLRTVLLIASEDLIVHDCKKWVGWWWRPFGTAQGQAWAQLIRVVAERACPVCRLMPPLEVDKATERDAGGGHAAAEVGHGPGSPSTSSITVAADGSTTRKCWSDGVHARPKKTPASTRASQGAGSLRGRHN